MGLYRGEVYKSSVDSLLRASETTPPIGDSDLYNALSHRLSKDRRNALQDLMYQAPQGTRMYFNADGYKDYWIEKVTSEPAGIWQSNDGERDYMDYWIRTLAREYKMRR